MITKQFLAVISLLLFLLPLRADEVILRPIAGPGPLDNPLKGWCPYVDAGPIHQPYSMVFLYVPWKDLEPEEGKYAFAEWEKRAWNDPLAKGKRIVFRVYIDYPSLASGLPTWMKAKGIKLTAYKDHGGGDSPDYDDPKMISALEKLIAALGKRYGDHPRIAFIQLGLLGFWGEWHTWPKEKLFASAATQKRVIDAFHSDFPNKLLQARYPGDAGNRDWLGYHDDMFPEDTDNGEDWGFLPVMRRAGRTGNWKVACIGGEMVPNRAKKWLGKDFVTTVKMAEAGHFSWVGPYCPALEKANGADFAKRSEELVRKLGYQFRLTEIRHPQKISAGAEWSIRLRGVNEGVAPFYYPWKVELALLNAVGQPAVILPLAVDIRKWLPGDFSHDEKVALKVAKGKYRLALGIRDPWTDRPAIRFANDLDSAEGWTVLSTIEIE